MSNSNTLNAVGCGTVVIEDNNNKIILSNVLHVPELKGNFISISKMTQSDKVVIFKDNFVEIKTKEGTCFLKAKNIGGIFIYENKREKCLAIKQNNNSAMSWHLKYGHVNFQCLKEMARQNSVNGFKINFSDKYPDCHTCPKAKLTVKPFENTNFRAKSLIELVHSDICGPFSASIAGSKYFATFIDDKSRYMCVYFLKSKDEVFDAFKTYKSFVENQTDFKIKCLRTDNGKEFVNKSFNEFLSSNGIKRQLTVPYTPQQNGIAERANRTLVELSRCMLLKAHLDDKYWAEAVSTSVYLRNRSITKVLVNMTPFDRQLLIFKSLAVRLLFSTRPIRRSLPPRVKK